MIGIRVTLYDSAQIAARQKARKTATYRLAPGALSFTITTRNFAGLLGLAFSETAWRSSGLS